MRGVCNERRAKVLLRRGEMSAIEEFEQREMRNKKKKAQWDAWEKLMTNPHFIEFREWRYNYQLAVTLPRDYVAEKAVIGALLLGANDYPDLVDYAMKVLKPHDFLNDVARDIFIAIAKLHNNRLARPNMQIDIVTINSYLRSKNKQDKIYSLYLTSAVGDCPSAANIKAYIEPVLECSKRRRLIQLGDELRYKNEERDLSSKQIMNATRAALDVIETGKSTDLKELFKENK